MFKTVSPIQSEIFIYTAKAKTINTKKIKVNYSYSSQYTMYIKYRDKIGGLVGFCPTILDRNTPVGDQNQSENITEIINSKDLNQLRVKDKKEQEVTEKNYWSKIFYVCSFLIILMTSLTLIIQHNKIVSSRNKNDQIETELLTLRSQMNPHFIFNTLNSLQSLILNSNRFEAYSYVMKFAKFIRLILENSQTYFRVFE